MTPTLLRVPRPMPAAAFGLLLVLCPGPAWGAAVAASQQSPAAASPEHWNGERVLGLVTRARELRHSASVDSAFRSYQAEARGYVYFFIDRPDSEERTLVKADQIALEVYWKAPDRTRQRIVGLRDQEVLPTNIRYHLDHLTVVQDDFGDWIQMGDGDEVERVLHPVGPGSEVHYDFRLADSLSIRLGAGEEVRVYEVEVRPRTPTMPAFVGSIFLARESAAIVRMNFTFTPASYVDPYLDYIRLSLDNSLWEGKYWLPYRQEVELRREMPALDFMAGSVIRGRFEIGAYAFNGDFPDGLFARRVTTLPQAQREAFPFERGLFDDLEEDGLAPTPSLESIRTQARQILAGQALSGLRRTRLSLGSASDALRYNRAEGYHLGGGVRFALSPAGSARLGLGWSFGRAKPTASLELSTSEGPLEVDVALYWDRLGDLGPYPGAATLVNSLALTAFGADYIDPWHRRGMSAAVRGATWPEGLRVMLGWEDHRNAVQVVEGEGVRPVRPVHEGTLGSMAVRTALPWRAQGGYLEAGVKRLGADTHASMRLQSRWLTGGEREGPRLSLAAGAGWLVGSAPIQAHYALGGRGTLPGFNYRTMVGTGFALLEGVATIPVAPPWMEGRLLAAAGGVHRPDRLPLPGGTAAWPVEEASTWRASAGAGVALLWDVLHLDLVRGLGEDGGWAWIFSVTPRFRPWL